MTVIDFLDLQTADVSEDEISVGIRNSDTLKLSFCKEMKSSLSSDMSTRCVIKAIVTGKITESIQTINRISRKTRIMEVESYDIV